MIFKIFNWLVKRVPYTFAVALPSTLWASGAGASFYVLLALYRSNFEATGTEKIFIAGVSSAVVLVVATIIPLREGFFRVFGLKWGEMKSAKILNNNIIKGEISKNISDQALLETFNALRNVNLEIIAFAARCTAGIIFFNLILEYFYSRHMTNIPSIAISGALGFSIVMIFALVLYELLTASARRECKKMMIERKIGFKETPLFSIKTKLRFFPLLTAVVLIAVLLLIGSLNLEILILSLLGFVISVILGEMVFGSIYQNFNDLKESAENLKKGREVISSFGSLDREVVELSGDINSASAMIYNAKQDLEQRKKDLEKFYSLTVGRELKMIELKQKIKEMEEKLKTN